MIQISQLKLPVNHTGEELRQKVAKELRLRPDEIKKLTIRKKSIDARKKPVCFVYTLNIETENEKKLLKRLKGKNISSVQETRYHFPAAEKGVCRQKPVIVGTGPAGLFCGLMLARAGLCPVLLERGESVDRRQKKVERFWSTGELDTESNVQFGEGGAGTFSDGKLNTLVKDPEGRGRFVLETFVGAGAPEEILYWNKPHIGTDVLAVVVKNMRNEIISLGGEVRFGTKFTDILTEDGAVRGVLARTKEGEQELLTDVLVLAAGHSARDTFAMLARRGISMEKKAFAVGVRIEHPQSLINESQYGRDCPEKLPAASYKLTRKVSGGRGVYSFCMCPGGYVVNASSEQGMLAVNGMSYHARDGRNANSAMIVTVRPEDFGGEDVLSGVEFQRRLERAAWQQGGGKIPVQLLGDFRKGVRSVSLGEIEPSVKGAWTFSDVRSIFPEELGNALEEGITGCGNIIPGFSRDDALLLGVESRTSSPVRILRDERLESALKGLYPCGEGAGYAGGITSAAMDGIRVAEMIVQRKEESRSLSAPVKS